MECFCCGNDKNWPLIDFYLYRTLFELNKLLNNEAVFIIFFGRLSVSPSSVGRQPIVFGPVLR